MDNNIFFETSESFSVPVRVVDMYLTAPDTELRLLLYILRYRKPSFRKDELLDTLGISEDRLESAFAFWCNAGILYKAENRYMLERPKVQTSDIMKYQAADIATRMNDSSDIRVLLTTAEKSFGRLLTTADASSVLALVDWIGLKTEVAMMLVEYCGLNKKSMGRMNKIGAEWAETGITTMERAEAYIQNATERDSILNRVSKTLGFAQRPLTETEKKLFYKWTKEYGLELAAIAYAYDVTVKNTGKYSYKYMETIIDSWHSKALIKLDDIKKAEETKPETKPVRGGKTRRIQKVSLAVDESMENSWKIVQDAVNNDDGGSDNDEK